MIGITLSEKQLSTLLRPARGQGGYQAFLEKLKHQVDLGSRLLCLSADDLEKLQRYVRRYGGGGWQARLRGIFGALWSAMKGGE